MILNLISRQLGFIGALFSLVFISSALAKKITLAEISKIAIENSDLLKAQLQEIQFDVLSAQGAGLLPNPNLAFQSGNLTSGPSSGLIFEAGVFQILPFPGKLSSLRKLAEIQKNFAVLQGLELTRTVQHEVTLLAVRLVVLKELSLHTEERQRRFRLIRQYLQTHPQVSPSQKAEAALIENQLRLLEKTILELEQERRVVDVGLQFFLKSKEPLEPEFSWLTNPSVPKIEQLEEILFKEGIDLQKKELDVQRAGVQASRARLSRWPDFQVGASYRSENTSPMNQFYTGFLTLNIPLFDRGQYSIPAAEARLQGETHLREYLRGQLKRQLQERYSSVETSARLLRAFPPELQNKTEAQFDAAEREFRKNRITSTQLLQLDAQVHETMDAIFRSQLDFLENLSHLLLFIGRPLEWK